MGVRAQAADLSGTQSAAQLAVFFQPPPELASDLSSYRSPLVFDDGRPVQSPQQWEQRRREILQFWQGAWVHGRR